CPPRHPFPPRRASDLAARSGLVEVLAKLLVGSLRRLVIRASVVVVRSRRLELAVRCVGVAVAVAHADTSAHTASAHWRVRAEARSEEHTSELQSRENL